MLKNFFKEIDLTWEPIGSEPFTLSVIGSTALFLQCQYERGTKDSDILEIHDIPPEVYKMLKKIAGKDTKIAKRHNMYLDIVGPALPFLPRPPLYHFLKEINEDLTHFQIQVLDITDVVVSKLKRFASNDVADIRAVIDLDLINHKRLVTRFLSAKEFWEMDSRALDLKKYIENLHTVERDFLSVGRFHHSVPPVFT